MSDGEDRTDFYLFSFLTQIISDFLIGNQYLLNVIQNRRQKEMNVVDEDLLLCWHFDTLHGALKAS